MFSESLHSPLPHFQGASSDPILALFYFFWLDLSYQNTLYLILLVLIFYYQAINLKLTLLFVSFLTIYNSGLNDFFTLNSLVLFSDHTSFSNNSLLTNSLTKYHPLLFYVSLISIFYFLPHSAKSSVQKKNYIQNFQLNIFFNLRYKIITINLFAVFLGSWWAFQEWSWGGWWNWDPSETLGLLPSLFLLSLTHMFISRNIVRKYRKKTTYLTTTLYFSVVLIQLNFEILSHNFGLKFFHFFNENFGKISVLLSLLLLLKYFSTLYFYQKFFLKQQKVNFLKRVSSNKELIFWLKVIVTTASLTILFFSFSQLVNYSFWKFLTLNFNFWTSAQPISLLTLTYFWFLVSWALAARQVTHFFYLTFFLPNIFYIGYFFSTTTSFKVLHLILGWLWISNQISLEKDFFNWSYLVNPFQITNEQNFLRENSSTFTLAGGLTTKFFFWKDPFLNSTCNYSLIFNSFENQIIQYLLGGTHTKVFNLQLLPSNRFLFYLKTNLHGLGQLVWLLLLILYFKLRKQEQTLLTKLA